jgi:hypothetical protein
MYSIADYYKQTPTPTGALAAPPKTALQRKNLAGLPMPMTNFDLNPMNGRPTSPTMQPGALQPPQMNQFQQMLEMMRANGGWAGNANRQRPVNFAPTPVMPKKPKFQALPVSRPPAYSNPFLPRVGY